MKKRWIRGAALGVVAAVTVALTGCSGGGDQTSTDGASLGEGGYSGPKVEITFWNGWTGGNAPKLVPQMVDKFNSEHDNITVKNVVQEWSDIASKLPLAIQSGNGPDVAVLHGDDLGTYAAQNLLTKADNLISTLGYSAKDFPPGVFDKGNYDGAQYAVPWSVTPLGLYINTDVAAKAGITDVPTDKQGYEAALEALKTSGVQGEWVDSFVFTGTFEFESLLWQFGGELYNEDVTKATFNSEAGVQALTWMADHISKGWSPADVSQDGDINALIAGNTAYNWNGVWQTTNTAFDGVQWKAAAVPQIGTQKAVWSSSTHWVFPANKGQNTDKTTAAATFVKWMNDNAAEWASTGELPAANTVRDDPSLVANYPNLKPFIGELDYAHYETVAPGINEANALITTALSNALTGKMSPKEALDDAAKQADQILEQNQAKYGG
ncbi:MAG: ABC transporter substrate-binding protein [Propionibacteriaceae bacterium]|jgi:multiple sugar transport system substrate-binding protein|nr:ABC transporter substrate-binding protein [Propionibacteriaceae bacterium]